MIEQYVASKTKIHAGGRAEWGKKHTSSQKIIFRNQVLPAIGNKECLRLTNKDLKKIIEECETVDLRDHVCSAISALVRWGCANGWFLQTSEMLLNDLRKMGKRKVRKAGESNIYVDPSEIPSHADVHEVAKQASKVSKIWWYELMFNLAAYSGLRFGEICVLDVDDIDDLFDSLLEELENEKTSSDRLDEIASEHIEHDFDCEICECFNENDEMLGKKIARHINCFEKTLDKLIEWGDGRGDPGWEVDILLAACSRKNFSGKWLDYVLDTAWVYQLQFERNLHFHFIRN